MQRRGRSLDRAGRLDTSENHTSWFNASWVVTAQKARTNKQGSNGGSKALLDPSASEQPQDGKQYDRTQ